MLQACSILGEGWGVSALTGVQKNLLKVRVELSLWLQKRVAIFGEYIKCLEDNYHSMNAIM